jgi:hypothetical protein
MYSKSELLFPQRSIADLQGLHGKDWDAMVRRIAALPELHPDSLAFTLMMVQMCQCTNCNMGSYKASLGCSACARRAIASRGNNGDSHWIQHFEAAQAEVAAYLARRESDKQIP